MKLLSKFLLLVAISFPVFAVAITDNKEEIVSSFRQYVNVSPSISVPKAIEVPFDKNSFTIPVFAVYNLTTKEFEPNLLSVNQTETAVRLTERGEVGLPSNINDGDYSTYFEFPVYSNQVTSAINFNFEKPITASSLDFTLDDYVALPQSISIFAAVGRPDLITVLAPVRPTSGHIVFPKTTSRSWHVSFSYIQPLRISEIKFNDQSNTQTTRGLRFLAQPGNRYQIYFDPDRYEQPRTKEAGDLFSSKGVVYVSASAPIANPLYTLVDSDLDSVPDLTDNCISVANSDQKDSDKNFLGDACEDYDRDGVVNIKDNCADVPNYAQTDTDKDGLGDICDSLDNRVTERMPWLPWVGIGVAGIVIFGLFAMVLMHKKDENTETN